MHQVVDPCDDFYQFSCGGYLRNKVLEKNEQVIDVMDDQSKRVKDSLIDLLQSSVKSSDFHVVNKMKIFYQTCTSKDQGKTVEFFKKIISEAGGWPVLIGDKWSENSFDFGFAFDKLSKYSLNVTFPVTMSELKLGEPEEVSSTGVSFNLYVDVHFVEDLVNTYGSIDQKIEKMIELSVMFGADPEIAARDMGDILQLENRLITAKQASNQPDLPQWVDLNSLKSGLTWIPHWDQILNASIKKSSQSLGAIYLFSKELKVKLHEPNFVPKFRDILEITPKRIQANYLFYNALKSVLEYLIDDFDTPLKKSNFKTKETFCLDQVLKFFDKAAVTTYLKRFVSSENIGATSDIVKSIKTQYLREIIKTGYPNEAVENIQSFYDNTLKVTYGYDQRWMEDDFIENYYSDLNFAQSSFYEMMLEANAFAIRKQLEELEEIEDFEEEHSADIDDVLENLVANAYFDRGTQKIVISAPVIEAPLLSPKYPTAFNYGRFGFIFAHELAHALLTNPLRDAIRTIQNTDCIIKQYGNITVFEPGIMLDGELTQDENIADIAGIRVAYNAYLTKASRIGFVGEGLPGLNYTAQQLFWISSASAFCQKINDKFRKTIEKELLNDEHTPSEVRINAAFANMEEFAEDFQCKIGSRMKPLNRCTGVRRVLESP